MNRPIAIRLARLDECDEIRSLIKKSSRKLATGFYQAELVEVALQGVLGVDTQLILDGTYFAAEHDHHIVGCGGWSWRQTLFGSDAVGGRDDSALEPAQDPAKIRAFFVHPRFARQGIASMILERCESAARAYGFHHFELGATLSGVQFYQSHGYIAGASYTYECAPGFDMEVVPMMKTISALSTS